MQPFLILFVLPCFYYSNVKNMLYILYCNHVDSSEIMSTFTSPVVSMPTTESGETTVTETVAEPESTEVGRDRNPRLWRTNVVPITDMNTIAMSNTEKDLTDIVSFIIRDKPSKYISLTRFRSSNKNRGVLQSRRLLTWNFDRIFNLADITSVNIRQVSDNFIY